MGSGGGSRVWAWPPICEPGTARAHGPCPLAPAPRPRALRPQRAQHAGRAGDRLRGRLLSFGELERRANRLAAALAARGVGPGDNVAILMYNRPEFVESFLAIQRLGACAVPVNFRLSQEEVDYVLADSRAVGILSDAELVAVGQAAAPKLAGIRFHLVAGPAQPERSPTRRRWRGRVADAAGGRGRRRAARLPDVHVGHDRAAEGGDADATRTWS